MEENRAMSSDQFDDINAGINHMPGFIIPADIFYNQDISDKAKLLASLILHHKGAKSFPTNKFYAQELQCTERNIVRLRSELREQGYLGQPNRDKRFSISDRMLLLHNKKETSNIFGYSDNNNNYGQVPENRVNKLIRPVGSIKFTGQPKTNENQMSPQDPTIKLPRKAKKIMQLWMDRHLRKTDFHRPTKVTEETIDKINLLLSGKLYGNSHSPGVLDGNKYKGRIFTIAEITLAMDRFEQAANDKYYHSFKKDTLKSVSLADFFYNPYGNNKTKCYFLWFLENEPVPLFNPDIENQKMYDFVVKAYLDFKKLSRDHELKTSDKSHLIDISNRLNRFVRVNKKGLPHGMVKYEYQAAMFLIRCALDYHKGNRDKITPYTIKGEWIFEALPNFVNKHRLTTWHKRDT